MRRLALALAALSLVAAADPPRVVTTDGPVRGVAEPDRLVFHGLPFAAPPLAERRWRPPAAPTPWTQARDATRPAPACLQNDQGWNRADHIFSSEDCLTLDVATPALTGKRPVIVWIHGGSNRAGSPAGMTASSIVRRGVVLVGVRYRLGVFGFLAHRGAAREAGGAAGNYALMDQIAALRWVRANIARFGGDPDNVTITGESAGSQDVGLLLASPMARGLFAKAGMQSGTPGFGLTFRPLEDGLRIGDQADALLDTGGDIAKLRSASSAALLATDLRLHDAALTADDYLWLRTTVDRAVLPEAPDRLLAKAPPRPVIIGSNSTSPAARHDATSWSPMRSAVMRRRPAPFTGSIGRTPIPTRGSARATSRSRPTSSSAVPQAAWRTCSPATGRRSGATNSTMRRAAAGRRMRSKFLISSTTGAWAASISRIIGSTSPSKAIPMAAARPAGPGTTRTAARTCSSTRAARPRRANCGQQFVD